MKRLDYLSTIAYSTKATLNHTFSRAQEAAELQGCFVECGIGAGAQIGAMALAAPGKQIYAFDSFEGIPMAGPHDKTQPGIGAHNGKGELVSSGISAHSIENVRGNLRKAGINDRNITYIKGWFQYTVPEFSKPIALLRLDGDLYESTKVCLQHLLPLVVLGGIVIIDDYSLEGCRKACDEFGLKGVIVPGSGGVMFFYKNDVT